MSQSNRGAAQVSLMWAIALLLVALVSLTLAFSGNSRLTQMTEERDAARVAELQKENEITDMIEKQSEVAKQLGWQAGDTAALPDLGLVKNSISELGATFPSVDPAAPTIEAIIPGLLSDYKASQTRVVDLERLNRELQDNLDARQEETQTALAEKDATISELRSENDDNQASLNDQLVNAERQRDALREQFRELDDRFTALEAEKDAEIASITNAGASLKQRNDVLSDRLNRVERRADGADGAILSANMDLGKAWIDLGRTSRVTPGLQFEVIDARSGSVKGRVQVASVEDKRAECVVLANADRYNPIAAGDTIRNGVFDPARRPVAVLLGNGFGAYSAGDMKAKLAEVGVSVVDDVSVEADYLLLGTPFFDEESGEMVAWDQQPAYRTAQGLSVEIVPRRDWLAWLGL